MFSHSCLALDAVLGLLGFVQAQQVLQITSIEGKIVQVWAGGMTIKSATNQTPRYAQPGEPGSEGWKTLELKLLADVGLFGFPSVGKSSFITKISAARPKIADYPFTTLTPNLGVVDYKNFRSFVVADIPGLIEGAHPWDSFQQAIRLMYNRHHWKGITHIQFQNLHAHASEPMWLQVDGEPLRGKMWPLDAHVRPGGLWVLAPPPPRDLYTI